MIKKYGVITFHFCKNYGALLQNYALVKYLRKIGKETYTLNAISEKQEKNNSLYNSKKGIKKILRNIILFPLHKKRTEQNERFIEFRNAYLFCTEIVENENELCNLIRKEQFDVLITGSDQVWNPQNQDFESMFFLPFKIAAKKYGYAVSLGPATGKDLAPFKNEIMDFQVVGIREIGSIQTIRQFNDSVRYNVDPVLLLDANDWVSLSTIGRQQIDESYLICYFINKKGMDVYYNVAKQCAKELGLKLYIINSNYSKYSYMNNTIVDAGPIEFVQLIKNAEFVCTDSFHGTVFSTILNTPFVSFIKSTETTDSRVRDFLTSVGLEDRILYKNLVNHDTYRICSNKIDFSQTNMRIKALSVESKEYLEQL